MNDMYLIPANSKSGKLIFNIFRPIDLSIALTGLALTLMLFFAIQSNNLGATIIKIIPISIGALLVVPVPYYHNVLCFIKDVYAFFANRRVYRWKGWCVRSEYGQDKQ